MLSDCYKWVAAATDLLFPPQCVACGTDMMGSSGKPSFCSTCLSRVLPPAAPVCGFCAAKVSIVNPCDDCPQCHGRRFHFDKVVALGSYDGELRQVLLRMKHASFGPLTTAMGILLAKSVPQHLIDRRIDLIVPVPMHWFRRLRRSTNSAESLAVVISRELAAPLASDVLVLKRNTKQQRTLSRSMRHRNMRGAFGVSAGYGIKGARILLVDDILTTGATASDAARALRASGAASVLVTVVARGSRTA